MVQRSPSAKRVAVLLGPGFEDSEFQVPTDRLRQRNVDVEVIGAEAGQSLTGERGRVTAIADKGIDEAQPADYDLLFIPGGHSPDKLRADARFVRFVIDYDRLGRPLAAVCHGPQLLAAAHLVKGRTLTAWQTIQDDLQQMGSDVKDEAVVTDGNWITSRKPDDLDQLSSAMERVLSDGGAAKGESDARATYG